MVSYARARRGRRRVAWPSSCSRNAHDMNVLVRRAQSRIDQATLENEVEDWDNARSEGPSRQPSRERARTGAVRESLAALVRA